MEYTLDHKRKVPTGIRAVPGHVPSTVFNSKSSSASNGRTALHWEGVKSQRRAETQLRNEEKKRNFEMLARYDPWGKPGGGAPRQAGAQMTMLERSLNESDLASGSLVDHMNKPGGGAPCRTDSGNPIGKVRVHADIRNNAEHLNEETKKRQRVSPAEPFTNGYATHHKSHALGARQHTDEHIRNNLIENLDRQVNEKRTSLENEKAEVSAPNIDWMSGKVGTIQRDSSGKLVRNGNLTLRGPDYIREYDAPRKGQKGLVDQLGKPGPGVALRSDSGHVHAQPRGAASNRDDPFRPGRNSKSPAVFPVDIETEANERAWKRHPNVSPQMNKHTIENGYYGMKNEKSQSGPSLDGCSEPEKHFGTVYSAILRTKGNYLTDLQGQIDEKKDTKIRDRKKSLSDDYKHIQYSDYFGRPGNGAPRLQDGELRTSRNKLEELATVGEGIRHPGAFRGLH